LLQGDPQALLAGGRRARRSQHPGADRRPRGAKARKNFAEADRIRKELLAQGIVLKDSPQGTTWEAASEAFCMIFCLSRRTGRAVAATKISSSRAHRHAGLLGRGLQAPGQDRVMKR
jgi:hypothetical protein